MSLVRALQSVTKIVYIQLLSIESISSELKTWKSPFSQKSSSLHVEGDTSEHMGLIYSLGS